MPAGKTKRDWMDFINDFVIEFGKKLVSMVHDYGKKAYVFYDDSWVGIEPYNGRFEEFGFDGMIKCVFSGYEARLCSGVPVETHELRLHPYLFPTGINGSPTFLEGGLSLIHIYILHTLHRCLHLLYGSPYIRQCQRRGNKLRDKSLECHQHTDRKIPLYDQQRTDQKLSLIHI